MEAAYVKQRVEFRVTTSTAFFLTLCIVNWPHMPVGSNCRANTSVIHQRLVTEVPLL